MIRQFDVCPTPFKYGRKERPYVIVVQSDHLEMPSRICGPLVDERFLTPERRLNPAFHILGARCYFHPAELMTLPVSLLRSPVANLESERARIIAALDLVFTGI